MSKYQYLHNSGSSSLAIHSGLNQLSHLLRPTEAHHRSSPVVGDRDVILLRMQPCADEALARNQSLSTPAAPSRSTMPKICTLRKINKLKKKKKKKKEGSHFADRPVEKLTAGRGTNLSTSVTHIHPLQNCGTLEKTSMLYIPAIWCHGQLEASHCPILQKGGRDRAACWLIGGQILELAAKGGTFGSPPLWSSEGQAVQSNYKPCAWDSCFNSVTQTSRTHANKQGFNFACT